MKSSKKIIPLLIGLVIVAFIGGRLTGSKTSDSSAKASVESTKPAAPEVWTCSMHPQIKLPKAGKCPICFMDLIPLEINDDGGGEREVRVSAYSAKLMEIETTEATRHFASAEIRMVGKVDYDETRVSFISAWVPGRIDRLFVDYTGVPVQKGDHLAELYSPDLLTAQEELIQAIQTQEKLKNSDSTFLVDTAQKTIIAAREKLRLWGFTAEQIATIETRGTPSDHMVIYSTTSGIVIQKDVQEGMYVKTGSRIYTIADLSTVWVQLDAYESDLNGLRYGGQVEFSTEAYPGKLFEGTISFIDPIINSDTRTAKVRVIVENENGRLKPGMFVRAVARPKITANGQIMDAGLAEKWISPMHPEIVKDGPGGCDVCGMPLVRAESLGYVAETQENAPLLIPVTAALKTGKRAVVYVEIPNSEKPSYEGREVRLGQRLGDFYVVEEGLEAGERVVTRGAFKLDAELQLRAKPSMMSPPEEADDRAGMDHEQMAKAIQPMETPAAFQQQLDAAVEAYLSIQTALAADDSAATTPAATALKEALKQIDMGLLEGEAHLLWMDHLKNLNAATVQLQKATSIEEQREAFAPLSQQWALTLRAFPIPREVTQAFCSMAFDNAGAIWLQSSEEINNPYFGAMMLKCGEVQKTIGASK